MKPSGDDVVGKAKTGKGLAKCTRNPGCKRGDVEVGFSSTHAGTGIHADVETGPVIDGGRGRHWRRLDGHIGRKSGRSDQCDSGDGSNSGRFPDKPPKTCAST